LHKEKEMLDFRKPFLALAVLALGATSAFAQNPPLSCIAQSAGTPSIRAEGVAELVGDIIVTCNGGNPVASNRALPQLNIQLFSQPSINITSRILTGGGNLIEFTEALLFIDEPTPADQRPCGSTLYPHSITPATTQTIIAGVCGAHAGSPTSNGIGTYNPATAAPTLVDGTVNYPTQRGNTYQARRAGSNSLLWQGIPFDPPGSLTSRILRITNVRVNASQLGVPAGSTATVAMLVSTSASGVFPGPLGGGPIALPITNPTPTVAVAQTSLDFSVADPQTCLQCESGNTSFFGDNSKALNAQGTKCDSVMGNLRFTERFPTVFRRRSIRLPLGDADPRVAHQSPAPNEAQDVLGTIYQTETGYYKPAATANWTSPLQNGTTSVGTSDGALGLADHGTRLIARFTNVQNGLQIWVQNIVPINTLQGGNLNTSTRTGTATLTSTDANGAGAFNFPGGAASPSGLGYSVNQVSIVGGTGQAVWEVVNADTTAIERVSIPVIITYRPNTAANLPTLGTSSANGSLAPLSTVATASTTAPLPRFIDTAVNRTLLTINSCRSNILFPFVTNQSGFDTGLAISNTSKDPFNTSLQTGACSVNFYGTIGNSKVCLKYPSPSITGGEHFVWGLSSGGAVTATAGFQGYVIAQCEFQYGHGFAFISDFGSARLAMGYLALIMDDNLSPSRTGSKSESLGH
jgi:hypothetical protein